MFSSIRTFLFQPAHLKTSRRNSAKVVLTPPGQDDVPQKFRLRPCHSLDLYEITVEKLQQLQSEKSLTCVEYVQYCLDRIHAVGNPFGRLSQLTPIFTGLE